MKRTLAALLAAVLVFAALCVCLPVSAETVNVAKGKSYVVSQQFRQGGADVGWGWSDDAPIAYPDDGVKLTDGILPADDARYSDPEWAGFTNKAPEYDQLGYSYIRVDLGAEYEISQLILYVATTYLKNGIGATDMTVGYYKVDDMNGSNAEPLGEQPVYDDPTVPYVGVSLEMTPPVTAQYIEVRMARGGWMFIAEFEAYADVSSGPSDPTDVRVETSELTALNETAPESPDEWYANGVVVAITNDGSEEKTITSGDYAMRYLYILVFDGNGTCVEIGNNLFSADDPRADQFPQHDVVIPAGGFAILFYYNVDNNANQALYDYYTDLGGAELYNETQKITTTYSAELKENSVVLYFGAKSAPETPSEPVMIGDLNGNGKVDAVDYMMLERYCLGTYMLYDEGLAAADIDGNGVVNATDYMLLKRVVLGTFADPNAYPPEIISAGDEPAFALSLQSSIEKKAGGKLIMTAVLTVKNIAESARLQEILATLRYDSAKMKLTNAVNDENRLQCVTALPYDTDSRWEDLITVSGDAIDIAVLNATYIDQYLDAEHPLELTFTFELAEGCTEATVSIASETVEGVYAAAGDSTVTVYAGEGATTTASYVDPDPSDPSDPEGPDFAVDLQSSIEKNGGRLEMTVVMTVKDFQDGVAMHTLGANLYYDASQMTLINSIDDNGYIECVTQWPYGEDSVWEQLSKPADEGVIVILVLNSQNKTQMLDAEHPLELTFRFELAEDDASAAKGTVTASVSVSNVSGVDIDNSRTYTGTGATTTASYVDPDPSDPTDPTDPDHPDDPKPEPAMGDIFGDGKIDSKDYMMLKRAVLGTGKLTEEQKALADINKDGKINSTDYMLLKRAVLGTYTIK